RGRDRLRTGDFRRRRRDEASDRRRAPPGRRRHRPRRTALHRSEGLTLHPALHTRFCALAGVSRPIVQTGMGWVSGARLTAATSAAGGLGILAAVTMTSSQLEESVRDVKTRTDKPFGVNFRADQPDLADRLAFV